MDINTNNYGSLTNKAGFVEYKMSEALAKELLKNRKGKKIKMRPVEYLCQVVNQEFGLKSICINVTYY